MTNLEFFENLNYKDGLQVITAILHRFPVQYEATIGLDGTPQIRPLEFKFEEDGKLYFDTIDNYESYAEMKRIPKMQLCVCDTDTNSYLRLWGTVHFTKDRRIVEKCFSSSALLREQFQNRKEMVTAYYLSDVTAEFESFSKNLTNHSYYLPDHGNTQVSSYELTAEA